LNTLRENIQGRVQIALHGTNGFEPALMKKCIAAGVSKINVNRLVLDNYYIHLKANVGKLAHTVLIEEGVKEVIGLTREWMDICGSTGKAT
jgi:fructose-bisphosphate aldolase, class II